jgi:hypothetical protein
MTLIDLDNMLKKKLSSRQELLSLKDAILRAVSEVPGLQKDLGLRLARINLQLKTASDALTFEKAFIEAAKTLLEPEILKMLKRAATEKVKESGHKNSSQPALSIVSPSKEEKGLASLAQIASARSIIKFDPATLFREFGRDRVLATWAGLLPEERPSTAHEMRELLRSKIG